MADKASFIFGGFFSAIGLGIIVAGFVVGEPMLSVMGAAAAAAGALVIWLELRKSRNEASVEDRINTARAAAAADWKPRPAASYERLFEYPRNPFNRGGRVFAIILGIFIIGFVSSVSVIFRENPDFPKILAAAGFFSILGIIIILSAVNVGKARIRITFSGTLVRYEKISMFRSSGFETVISDYIFALPFSEVLSEDFSNSNNRKQYTAAGARLIHKDNPAMDIKVRLILRDYGPSDLRDDEEKQITDFAAGIPLPVRIIS